MRARQALLSAIMAMAGLGFLSGPARAGSMEVAPTTIDLPAGSGTAVFYITNRGTVPIVAQIEAYDSHQTEKADRLDRSDSLLVSPPMARLMPAQRQIVRLAFKGAAAAGEERAFRVLVSELPDPQAEAVQGIKVMLQFSVPVFKAGGGAPTSAHLAWNVARGPDGLSLVARNLGTRHVKLSNLALATSGGRQIAIVPKSFAYILAGMSHRWLLASDLKSGETLHLTAHDDSADATIDAPVVQ